MILVTTTRDKTELHEKIYQFYTKRGFQVRFLIGRTSSSADELPSSASYIIGDFEDRYENLHFKTFSLKALIFGLKATMAPEALQNFAAKGFLVQCSEFWLEAWAFWHKA